MGTTPPTRPVSVKDVAAAAGVSLGTVSNVLNRPEKVAESTRTRVARVMSELGFVRNESARQLRAGKSRVLAYVMLDASNPFFHDVARGVEDVAEPEDLVVFSCHSDQDALRERTYLDRLAQQRVQGVLVTPVDPDSAALVELSERGTPVVVVDRVSAPGRLCSVAVDDVRGGRIAVEHLLERGHRRIAYIGGPERIGQIRDRRTGARLALEQAGLPPDSLVELATESLTVAEGIEAGSRIAGLSGDSRPTAAFCANDLVALGLLQQCVALGVSVPGDLAIVGYDDIDFAAAAAVPLTSVRQPRRELGRRATQLLLDEATNPDHVHDQVTFVPELVARASTSHS
ncbi:LacI family DNA-binding transcriptional regulator [Ornithinicoccus halotolerans]|uniref:LacI family DNA-binding transcriptional regulator n=1 Tax=Ornithinicoccus halotolerans TaxID=1748220 RepID=UPI0012976B39|nr:LacI family DNA-binding transcriptional regulator [Ornithinicoccus halotolerans]